MIENTSIRSFWLFKSNYVLIVFLCYFLSFLSLIRLIFTEIGFRDIKTIESFQYFFNYSDFSIVWWTFHTNEKHRRGQIWYLFPRETGHSVALPRGFLYQSEDALYRIIIFMFNKILYCIVALTYLYMKSKRFLFNWHLFSNNNKFIYCITIHITV